MPVGDAVNPKVACVTPMMCAPTEEEALRPGLEGANFFGYSLAHYYVFGDHQPGRTDVWDEFRRSAERAGLLARGRRSPRPSIERLGAKVGRASGDPGLRGAIGTPDQIREFLRRYEEAGVDQLIFVIQAGKNRHEHIWSLELFGREVLPEFKERDEQAGRDKQRRLAPVIDKVMARKPAEDHPPLSDPDYSFPAIPLQIADRLGQDQFYQLLQQVGHDLARGDRDGMERIRAALTSRPK